MQIYNHQIHLSLKSITDANPDPASERLSYNSNCTGDELTA